MDEVDFAKVLGPKLAGALEKKGFTSLTPVQLAVLEPELAGRDLRITSQTGSGKTVAIGFVLREEVANHASHKGGAARPCAIVVAPTRELAKQVEEELSWLYAPVGARVISTTGGASVRDERRALSSGPAVVVGTPGRLLDHLERGAIDMSELGAIVLDEADRMLDLGFREELEAILGHAPEGHRTHLCSATFPRDVRALADRVQQDPAHVEGTRLGVANVDIAHVIHMVQPRERVSAIINLLIANPDEQTLIFARTRADVGEIASELSQAGFSVGSLSGEMEQRERNRALAAFRSGDLRALVATDVAARGIDVQDIARVIHAEPPNDADSYTHRSGRTGRAGRQGTSSVLVSPVGFNRTVQLLRRAAVAYKVEPIPTAETIRHSLDEKFFAELVAEDDAAQPIDERTFALALRLSRVGDVPRVIARLLARSRHGAAAEPRDVFAIAAPTERKRPTFDARPEPRAPRTEAPRADTRAFVPFRVSWGEEHGADPRRLLAIACRRGGIRGSDVGAIRVLRVFSLVEVAAELADAFAIEAAKPDPRNPRVSFRRDVEPQANQRGAGRRDVEPQDNQRVPPLPPPRENTKPKRWAPGKNAHPEAARPQFPARKTIREDVRSKDGRGAPKRNRAG